MSNECPGCGSKQHDRENYRKQHSDDSIPLDLATCGHCGAKKCCMCDMGDDVECISCNQHGDDA